MNTLGSRIREARKALDMTGEVLARKAGVSKGFMSEIENDKTNVSVVYCARIAQALGVSLDWLVSADVKPRKCPFCEGRGVLK